jgi:Arc/MetJ-type ribon-helix-helix transcriptional regulator
MQFQLSPTVEQLIRAKMASGQYSSEDELLLDALQSLDESDEEMRAIALGLESVERGDEGILLDEAFDKLRQRHNIPRQS